MKPSARGGFWKRWKEAIPGRWCARLRGVSMVCDPLSSRWARISLLVRSLPEVRLGILEAGRDRLDALEVEEGLLSRAVQRPGPREDALQSHCLDLGVALLREDASEWELRKTSFVSVLGDVCLAWSLRRGNRGAEDRTAGRKEGLEPIPRRTRLEN